MALGYVTHFISVREICLGMVWSSLGVLFLTHTLLLLPYFVPGQGMMSLIAELLGDFLPLDPER